MYSVNLKKPEQSESTLQGSAVQCSGTVNLGTLIGFRVGVQGSRVQRFRVSGVSFRCLYLTAGYLHPHMKLNGVRVIRKANFIDPSRSSMYSEISNSKHPARRMASKQIPN
jgi:hypothetical protein